nr:hypothetical protein CFP56_55592 [Quercus suber]
MNFRNTSTLLIIFVICVAILSRGGVEATRVLSEDFGNANSLKTGSPIYVKAKDIMTYWLQRYGGVEATRVLSEDFGNANSLQTDSPIYVKAKDIMAYWLQRLPSGPSPGGEGH